MQPAVQVVELHETYPESGSLMLVFGLRGASMRIL
jgi:hypothetical protein